MLLSLHPLAGVAHRVTNPWLPIGTGVFVLIVTWIQYFRLRKTMAVPLSMLVFLNVVGATFSFMGARMFWYSKSRGQGKIKL